MDVKVRKEERAMGLDDDPLKEQYKEQSDPIIEQYRHGNPKQLGASAVFKKSVDKAYDFMLGAAARHQTDFEDEGAVALPG